MQQEEYLLIANCLIRRKEMRDLGFALFTYPYLIREEYDAINDYIMTRGFSDEKKAMVEMRKTGGWYDTHKIVEGE